MMNLKERSPEWVALIRECYPVGCRIEVDKAEFPAALPKGSRGTVTAVHDSGLIHVAWDDNPYELGLASGRDYFHRIGGYAG